jgi:hypothetical protein
MRSTTVRVLFDTGSQRTYITNSLKSRLGLKPVEKESLRLNTFGDDRVQKETCDIVKLSLQKGDGERVDVAGLCFPVICSSLPLKVEVNAYPHIEGLALADAFDDQDSGSTTNLIISGEFGNRSANGYDELKSTLKQFWEDESIGIRESEDSSINQLSKSFLKNIKYEDHRYEVSLPWKEEQMDVPTNYNFCLKNITTPSTINWRKEWLKKFLRKNWEMQRIKRWGRKTNTLHASSCGRTKR